MPRRCIWQFYRLAWTLVWTTNSLQLQFLILQAGPLTTNSLPSSRLAQSNRICCYHCCNYLWLLQTVRLPPTAMRFPPLLNGLAVFRRLLHSNLWKKWFFYYCTLLSALPLSATAEGRLGRAKLCTARMLCFPSPLPACPRSPWSEQDVCSHFGSSYKKVILMLPSSNIKSHQSNFGWVDHCQHKIKQLDRILCLFL